MNKVDYKKLKEHCVKPHENYFSEYKKYKHGDNISGRYIYINNNSKVLGIAHIDTVFKDCADYVQYRVLDSDYVFSPNLDDRLGIYTLLDYLPKMGINLDILLTENEEMCLSTAYNFKTNKKYNWVVEFDRMKNNPVCYQYKDKNWNNAIKAITGYIDYGTYSDICDMEFMGISAVNWGIGYQEQHTKFCRMDISEYILSMEKFKRFYDKNYNTWYAHAKTEKIRKLKKPKNQFIWEKDYIREKPIKLTGCDYCNDTSVKISYIADYEMWLCSDCLDYWDKQYTYGKTYDKRFNELLGD